MKDSHRVWVIEEENKKAKKLWMALRTKDLYQRPFVMSYTFRWLHWIGNMLTNPVKRVSRLSRLQYTPIYPHIPISCQITTLSESLRQSMQCRFFLYHQHRKFAVYFPSVVLHFKKCIWNVLYLCKLKFNQDLVLFYL